VRHLETLVGKVIEENTNLETEVGVKLQRREFDLWPVVEALIHDLHPVAETGSTRLINSVPEDFVVYADASLIKRVLQNLIANAISYTPRGEITIGARDTGRVGEVECFVRDNGAGIQPERLQFVFDKEETDPNKEGGLGLGLAIVKTALIHEKEHARR
jgi:two-component system, OmpR family, phosphate regulon sensor histidine kinase PhoR